MILKIIINLNNYYMKTWNEIDLEMFTDIFDRYWNKESNTIEKVLEIQNLAAIREGHPNIRVYFGAKIDINDYKEYNKDALMFLDLLKEAIGEDFLVNHLSMCIVIDDGPRINPLGKTKDHKELLWSTFSGEKFNTKISGMITNPLVLWFRKTTDGLYIAGDQEDGSKLSYKEKYIRIRGWEYKDWKNMMDSYCQSGGNLENLYPEDDVKRDKILYRREEIKIPPKPYM